MTPQATTDSTEIPILPGHYRQTTWYFVRCFLGMIAGIGVFGLGLHWQVVAIQVAGGVIAFTSFLCFFGLISRVRSARCPSCSTMMSQGWDTARACSDGVFACPRCQSRWRTSLVLGLGGD